MPSTTEPKKTIEAFFSYSHKDQRFKDQLEIHLSLLKREGLISSWHDRMIGPGEEWARKIDEHLNTAQIILLLVSADFIASDYCYSKEMEKALKRHEAGEAKVIPIILRPTDWKSAPFGNLQALPRDGKPITDWKNRDNAFFDITQGIRKVAQELLKIQTQYRENNNENVSRVGIKILVADDDHDLVDMLSYWLKGHGYDVVRAFDGEQAMKRWHETLPDLVILDLEMPKLDGFDVIRQMQGETDAMVLILTAHHQEDDEVRGLDLGANDYLRKPFSPRQLLARIKALMRRSKSIRGSSSSSAITGGPITLDAIHHEVIQDGIKVRLTPTESRLLHLLITHTGQVLTTDMIVERVWGYDEAGDYGLVKTHIRHLRQKVELDAKNPQYILTVPNVGYTFTIPTSVKK